VAEPEDLKYNPESIVDAQFSMPFGAAVAILHGKASLDQYTQNNLRSPLVKDTMRKIKCLKNPEIEADFPRKWPAIAKIKTTDGNEYIAKVEYPKGDPENPFTWDEIMGKFRNLISAVFPEARQNQIIETIRSLDQTRDVTELYNLLVKEYTRFWVQRFWVKGSGAFRQR
jgi:2-methylcitrate dehydratase PrpD